jgi:hypothetical protein
MLKRVALVLLALVISGIPALFTAGMLADSGYLGSCFEGACGYAAIFYAFPLFWIVLFIAIWAVWSVWRRLSRLG